MSVQFTVPSDYKCTLIVSDSLNTLISLHDQYPQNELIQLTKELISS